MFSTLVFLCNTFWQYQIYFCFHLLYFIQANKEKKFCYCRIFHWGWNRGSFGRQNLLSGFYKVLSLTKKNCKKKLFGYLTRFGSRNLTRFGSRIFFNLSLIWLFKFKSEINCYYIVFCFMICPFFEKFKGNIQQLNIYIVTILTLNIFANHMHR